MMPGLGGSASKETVERVMQLANNPAESEQVQAIVTIVAELEYRQLEAVEDLHDALDVDGLEVNGDREARREQLKALVEAIANQNITDYWFEEVASEHIENAEKATAYAGIEEDEWESQIGQWSRAYRRRLPDREHEGMTDRDLAAEHIFNKFGVGIEEFEREVVQFSEGDALRNALARNFEAVEAGIDAATNEVDG